MEETLACVQSVATGRGSDLWHPDSGRALPRQVAVACGRCRRRTACLTEALTRAEEHGIWAGLPPSVRRVLRQRMLLQRDRTKVISEGLEIADRMRETAGAGCRAESEPGGAAKAG